MPNHPRVSAILHTFMADLEKTIRSKVAEAVARATRDFCAGTDAVAETVKDAAQKIPRKYQRRARKARAAKAKKVRLSKNGKRIGRPPKVKGKQGDPDARKPR